MNLVVLDTHAPWVQSLCEAMPDDVHTWGIRPQSPPAVLRHPLRAATSRGWRRRSPAVLERHIVVPSWSRCPKWSSAVAARVVAHVAEQARGPTVVVYTLPWYGPVAARLPHLPSVYFAFDPYEAYAGWDAAAVNRGQAQLLAHCQAVFAVSPALADDFRTLTDKPVFVQPNGIAASRLDRQRQAPPRPVDLPAGGRIALCVGQLSAAYDWALLAAVADAVPDMHLVFVGPLLAMSPSERRQVESVLERPNVVHLGYREPHALPAYLAHADVLFSPLAVTPANHRRSLLRIYDYLATDRPVVATPVASAVEHADHLALAETPGDFAAALRAAVDSPRPDRCARASYLSEHTWEQRARLFLTHLEQVLLPAAQRVLHVS